MLGQSAVLNIHYLEYFAIIVVNQIADRFVLDVSWGLEKSKEKCSTKRGEFRNWVTIWRFFWNSWRCFAHQLIHTQNLIEFVTFSLQQEDYTVKRWTKLKTGLERPCRPTFTSVTTAPHLKLSPSTTPQISTSSKKYCHLHRRVTCAEMFSLYNDKAKNFFIKDKYQFHYIFLLTPS